MTRQSAHLRVVRETGGLRCIDVDTGETVVIHGLDPEAGQWDCRKQADGTWLVGNHETGIMRVVTPDGRIIEERRPGDPTEPMEW